LAGANRRFGMGFLAPTGAHDKGPALSLRRPKFCPMVGCVKREHMQPQIGDGMTGEIEARLKALNLVLPEVPLPVADYVSFLHLSGQLFVAGQLPLEDGKLAMTGTLGAGVDLAQGQEAARLCALNILAQAKAALGDLDRIVQCLRLNGFVSSAPGFIDHPKVINGASELIVKVLGQKGRHTRIAVGCSSLPLGAPVEIDAIFAVD
jgi:enamine deaminase RidA (YjgF/YER057c/UK114 family)